MAVSVNIALENIRILDQLIAVTRQLIPLLQQCAEHQERNVALATAPTWAIGHVYHDWALDPASPWSFEASDGNAIIGQGGWVLYKAAHLLCDVSQADVPEIKEAYKLPVAKLIGGRMTYFWHAVSAAYAALKGARGGLADVPETVIAGTVNGPIKALYAAFDKELEE